MRLLISALLLLFLLAPKAEAKDEPKLVEPKAKASYSFENAKNVLFLIDCSKSMEETYSRVNRNKLSKYEYAKVSLKKILECFPPDTNVALRVYGHYGNIGYLSCKATQLVTDFKKMNRKLFIKELDKFQPAGMSPLTYALHQAIEKDIGDRRKNTIVFLVSDGVDTCGRNPVQYVKSRRNIFVPVVIFALDIRRDNARNKLVALSHYSSGIYYEAKELKQLMKDIRNSFKKKKKN